MTSLLATQVPIWVTAILFVIFWLSLNALSRFVRLWAFLTLPATFLHELSHGFVGLLLGAQPSSVSLWPKKVTATAWRLGYVGFARLRWWNGGAVTLAPLLWLLLIGVCIKELALLTTLLGAPFTLKTSILLSIALIWLTIAFTPSRTDWKRALTYWPSALAFLALWVASVWWLFLKNLIE
jgi:hypothetical protein